MVYGDNLAWIEKHRAYSRAYYKKNRVRLLKMDRERKQIQRDYDILHYPSKTREYWSERMRKYYKDNPKYRQYIMTRNLAYRMAKRLDKTWINLSTEEKKQFVLWSEYARGIK